MQEVGPEHLSLARLRRECAARGATEDNWSWNCYDAYGFHLQDLPLVVQALDPPTHFRTPNGLFSGEEGVLLLLLRYRKPGTLLGLTWETGRNKAQLSEAIRFTVEHVHRRFPHRVDIRSFTAWARRFGDFAEAFSRRGVPIDNLVGFIDGKLNAVCRPSRYQHVLYSGHKRIHGLKVQGTVFPNGIQPFPFGPINGNRHDSHVLRAPGPGGTAFRCGQHFDQHTHLSLWQSSFKSLRHGPAVSGAVHEWRSILMWQCGCSYRCHGVYA